MPRTDQLWPSTRGKAASSRSNVKLLSRLRAYSERRIKLPRYGPGCEPWASLGRPNRPLGRRQPLHLQKIGDHEGHLDRLLRIEARIAKGVIPIMQIRFRNDARPAGAFGHVLAGHLEMNSAGVDTLGAAGGEEVAHFLGDAFSRPRLVAARGLDRIAVHRVRDPQELASLAFDRAQERRQRGVDLVRAEPADQREAARLLVRIEDLDQAQELVGRERRTAFEADRVLHPPAKFDVSAAELTRAVADPDHVA